MANRVSQVAVEVTVLPDDQKVRASHVAVEAAMLPDDQRVRVTQVAVEVLRSYVIPPRAKQRRGFIVG